MSLPGRLAAFALGLAAAFGAGAWVGATVGPEPAPPPPHAPDTSGGPHSSMEHGFG